jgi:hypothetical protein
MSDDCVKIRAGFEREKNKKKGRKKKQDWKNFFQVKIEL